MDVLNVQSQKQSSRVGSRQDHTQLRVKPRAKTDVVPEDPGRGSTLPPSLSSGLVAPFPSTELVGVSSLHPRTHQGVIPCSGLTPYSDPGSTGGIQGRTLVRKGPLPPAPRLTHIHIYTHTHTHPGPARGIQGRTLVRTVQAPLTPSTHTLDPLEPVAGH